MEGRQVSNLDEIFGLIGEHIPSYAPGSILFPFRMTREEVIKDGPHILPRIYTALRYRRLADVLSLIILSPNDFERIFVFGDNFLSIECNTTKWCTHLLAFALVIAVRGPPEELDYKPYDASIRSMNDNWINPDMMLSDIGRTGPVFPYMAFMRKMDLTKVSGMVSRVMQERIIGLRYIKMAYHARVYLRKNANKMCRYANLLDTFCSRFNMSSCFAIIYKDEYSDQLHVPNFNKLLIRIIKSAFRIEDHFSEFFHEYLNNLECSAETKEAIIQKTNSSEGVQLLSISDIRQLNNSWHFSLGLLPQHNEFYISLDGALDSVSAGLRTFEYLLYRPNGN
jgi:hypothetical protein